MVLSINKLINMLFRYLCVQSILSLPRFIKIMIVLVVDASLCGLAAWTSFYLRIGEWISFIDKTIWRIDLATLCSLLIMLPILAIIGVYRSIYRYSGMTAAIKISKSIFIYGIIYSFIFTVIGVNGIPRTIGLIQPMLLLLFVLASRSFAKYLLGGISLENLNSANITKVIIYGTGIEGRQLADALSSSNDMHVMGFIDDDASKHGQLLNGQKIYNINELEYLKKSLGIKLVLLAIPKASQKEKNKIIKKITRSKVTVRTLPSFNDLLQGHFHAAALRNLEIDDLIGREPIVPNDSLLKSKIFKKVVLVTGAGGSIGSELCKQVLQLMPKVLLLIDSNEYALYTIDSSLTEKNQDNIVQIIPLIAHVQDRLRMAEILETWKPDTIYHAAAYKHVPMVEHNPVEGIYNNVFGTLVVAELAIHFNIKDFVLISTDKAVRPTSIMGATKRLSEMILQSLAAGNHRTILSMVRFGNVLGSSGSVVPKFNTQIQRGGPITLTHLDITRYFMTISEAAQLVIQAGAMAQGGEVFVLDMGEPVRIFELAKGMVELSGHTLKTSDNPEGDIGIEITGLRPGEKLYEELLIGDNPQATDHPRIMKASEGFLEWNILSVLLESLRISVELKNVETSIELLQKCVINYIPAENINDWLYLNKLRKQT